MLKLRTVYLYGLNGRIEDKHYCKSGKEWKNFMGKAFTSLSHIMEKDSNASH